MYYSIDLCFLCLAYNKNIKLEGNSYLQMREELKYLIPEHIPYNSETPKYVCNNCIQSLNEINAFRRKCLKNIAIFNEYEQQLTHYGSHKYFKIVLTNILHHNNAELNCNVEIKAEIFEVKDSNIQNDIEINETSKVVEKDNKICDKLTNDREVKSEICEIYDFKPPTEYQTKEISNDVETHKVFIKVEDKIENNYIKHEINEELIIKEEVEQQELFCVQNDLLMQNESANSAANENDSTAAVSVGTQNQELLQNIEMLKCKKCPKTYFNKKDLKIHYRIHKKICDICQKSFSTSTYLRNHKLAHTGIKPYVCDVCQKAFNQINDLKKHKFTHSGDKPHTCDVCQKTFSILSYLKKHKRVHTGEKPYVCNVCQKTFGRKDILTRHKLTHSGEKQHTCDTCQKLFGRKSELKIHKLVHTGEKPYSCDVCQKRFSQIGYFKIHKRMHCAEKPYECDVCQETFGRKGHLKTHKLVHKKV